MLKLSFPNLQTTQNEAGGGQYTTLSLIIP